MSLSKGSKAVIILAILALSLFPFMLYFRAVIYSDIYVAPNEPYGLADIIELYLGYTFILLSAISSIVVITLLIRGVKQSKIAASLLVVLHFALYASFITFHNWVANCCAI